MYRAVFLDRDGTIAKDVNYCRRLEDFEFLPGAKEGIKLLNENNFKTIVITNQSGIARGYFTEEILARIHHKMNAELKDYGAHLDAVYYCPHHPDDDCQCRKPNPKLVYQAIDELGIDYPQSFVVGDRLMDIQLARTVGCKSVMIDNERGRDELKGLNYTADYIATDLEAAGKWIIKQNSLVSGRLNK